MNPIPLFFVYLVFIADGLMVFLIPILVYAETQSLTYSGLAYALWWLPRIVLTPLLGAGIDRWGVRTLSIASDSVKALSCLLLCLVLHFTRDPLVLSLCAGLFGTVVSAGNAQTTLAFEKLIATFSQDVNKDANLLTRADLTGFIAGPLLGILFYDSGYMTILFIAATGYLINAYYFLTTQHLTPATKSAYFTPPDLIPLWDLLKSPLIIFMILLAAGNNFFAGLIASSGPAIIETKMALPIEYFGLIQIFAGTAGMVTTFIYGAGRQRFGKEAQLAFGVLIITLSSFALSHTMDRLIPFLIFYSLCIAGKVFTDNVMRTLRINLIPSRQLACTSSLIVMLNQSILPFMWLFLFIAEHYHLPIQRFMYTAVAISLLSGLGIVLGMRKIQQQAHLSSSQTE
ncbi:MFS transporter [Lonsdalea quercina]|uniref:MFS transporter n=1 Tax=Lonsdalea quercina TaxID=71657 RepID=UPI00047C7E84|nr:MFS transporter [Lonsdalea quercina]